MQREPITVCLTLSPKCINEIIASSSKLESLLNQLFEEFIKYDRLLKNHLLEEEELVYPQLLAMSAEEHEDFLRLTSRESIIKAREARRKELESKE